MYCETVTSVLILIKCGSRALHSNRRWYRQLLSGFLATPVSRHPSIGDSVLLTKYVIFDQGDTPIFLSARLLLRALYCLNTAIIIPKKGGHLLHLLALLCAKISCLQLLLGATEELHAEVLDIL